MSVQVQEGWIVIAWEDESGYQDIYVMVKEDKPLAVAQIRNVQVRLDNDDDIYIVSAIGRTYPVRTVLKSLRFRWNGVEWIYRTRDEADAFNKFFETTATLMNIL